MAKKKPVPTPFIDAPPEETPDVPEEAAAPVTPNATDRPPQAADNPRHVVLICEDRDGEVRPVTVRNPGDQSVRVGDVVYHHTHEDSDGKWIYTRLHA